MYIKIDENLNFSKEIEIKNISVADISMIVGSSVYMTFRNNLKKESLKNINICGNYL